MELRQSNETELDLPPEYCHYRDEGCEFADSCLNCPLPMCVHDEPGGRQGVLKRRRARAMVRLFAGEGKGTKELAQLFRVSQRTVQRTLKAALKAETAAEVPDDE